MIAPLHLLGGWWRVFFGGIRSMRLVACVLWEIWPMRLWWHVFFGLSDVLLWPIWLLGFRTISINRRDPELCDGKLEI